MDDFLWGVATSAYQAEGGYNGPGQPLTNWGASEQRGDVAVAGLAVDFWNRYEEDFARCRELGLKAFRLGLEWSRIQPGHGAAGDAPPPPFDFAALDHYAAMIEACRRHGLEPVVTLHHFVHPAWLGTDPWLHGRTPDLFVEYVRTAVERVNERLSQPIRWFITINEPNMLVLNSYLGRQFPAKHRPGLHVMTKAYNQLLRAHVLAYSTVHDLYEERGWPAPQVTFNNYCSDVYWSDKMLLDLVSLRERGIAREDAGLHICQRAHDFERAFNAARIPLHKDLAYYFGAALKRISNWVGYRSFDAAHFAPFLETLYAQRRTRFLDYIGIDYYDPFAAHAFRLPVVWDHEFKNRSLRSWMLATVTSKWWDWRVLPRGLHFFCKYYAEDFGRPVLIAENGMALRRRADGRLIRHRRRDRMTRSQFLRLHVHEVAKIRADGVPLIGYLHWSLFDNYEWGTYTPRFGLFSIDFPYSVERNVEAPDGDRPAETYAALIADGGTKAHVPHPSPLAASTPHHAGEK
jgi:beta-glucosidase/6-phospho-beta-glucosidase/beta-galactosidase